MNYIDSKIVQNVENPDKLKKLEKLRHFFTFIQKTSMVNKNESREINTEWNKLIYNLSNVKYLKPTNNEATTTLLNFYNILANLLDFEVKDDITTDEFFTKMKRIIPQLNPKFSDIETEYLSAESQVHIYQIKLNQSLKIKIGLYTAQANLHAYVNVEEEKQDFQIAIPVLLEKLEWLTKPEGSFFCFNGAL